MSRNVGGFRLSFLARFALSTFLAAVIAAAALTYVLIDRHIAAIEADEGVTAAGQIAELLNEPLADVPRAGRPDGWTLQGLRLADEAAKRLQFVDGFRIYRYDGSELYPTQTRAVAPEIVADVRRTLQTGTLWTRLGDRKRSETFVQYLPFATKRTIFVLAIDLSRAALSEQERGEVKTIVVASAGAIAIVFFALIALATGASRELELRRREAQDTFVRTLTILAEVIDRRDPYTAGHSSRVAAYAKQLAVEMKLSRREIAVVEHAALLHDLGKIGIPDAVLLKPSRLDAQEREIIERHPVIGGEMLGSISTMSDIAPCVLHHHERIDGRGYPHGLPGERIPLGARLIAVADTFDAMTTDRPYRRALSVEASIAEMRRVSGTQLEAAFVEAFLRLVGRGDIVPPRPAEPDEPIAERFGTRLGRAATA
ncbi:MAG: HD-GYP domain-containing protein [Candidatus Eremiobacteraeota bacterium]|nr:HD-GYP domain-containing protein [Candidatus Eremiobacteraeota bacterium]